MGETTEILTIEELYKCVYIIRGQQVMFDQDLAAIYGYEVKRLNEQVKRNIRRFPEDFMFQIEPEEVPDRLKSQIATLRNKEIWENNWKETDDFFYDNPEIAKNMGWSLV